MKKHLAWAKKHWLFVVLLVVAIVAFPVLFVISNGMNSKIRSDVESTIRSQSQQLNALNVNYSVEPILPGSPGYTASRPPNAATTEALKRLLAQNVEQIERARQAIVEFNRSSFAPIVDGLFPTPTEVESVAKRDAMSRRWVPWNVDYLRGAGAGTPPAPEEVARRVEEKRMREVDRLLGVNPDAAALTPELEDEIRKALVNERLSAYSAPAQQSILFYASPSALVSVAPYTGTTVPDLELCWEWQWISWVNEMVINAIRTANEPDLAVAYAAIKRLERLEVEPLSYPAGGEPVVDTTEDIPLQFDSSISGRAYNPENPNALYDVRYANVQMIVASRRIPEILDAFARSNLITAVDLDIANVDDLQSLASSGYSFGGDHVVRVHMRLETVWLREWTREFMPPTIRYRLRVAPPEGQENVNPGAGAQQGEEDSGRGGRGTQAPQGRPSGPPRN